MSLYFTNRFMSLLVLLLITPSVWGINSTQIRIAASMSLLTGFLVIAHRHAKAQKIATQKSSVPEHDYKPILDGYTFANPIANSEIIAMRIEWRKLKATTKEEKKFSDYLAKHPQLTVHLCILQRNNNGKPEHCYSYVYPMHLPHVPTTHLKQRMNCSEQDLRFVDILTQKGEARLPRAAKHSKFFDFVELTSQEKTWHDAWNGRSIVRAKIQDTGSGFKLSLEKKDTTYQSIAVSKLSTSTKEKEAKQ